jgi:hypothetical protein
MSLPKKPLFPTVRQKSRRPMTVCIACICEHGLIVGASDRMLTSGDTEFEAVPSSAGTSIINKFTPVSETVVAMLAGESGLQVEILKSVISFAAQKAAEKNAQPSVKAILNTYIHFYDDIKQQRAASSILAPLGLNPKTFISSQKQLSDGFSETIARALIDFPMPPVETIIAGRDSEGSHLYKLFGNQWECCDLSGFAAIGSGARHAEAEFMSRGYSIAVPQEEALWLIYMAKRKSESAPGVGEATDMFAITNKSPFIRNLTPLMEGAELKRIYEDFEVKQDASFKAAQDEIRPRLIDYLEKQKGPPPPKKDLDIL